MALAAGRLRQFVTIQSNERVRVGTGYETNWTDVAGVRAEIVPANGGEAFAQGVQRETQFYRVTLRFRTDVTPKHRLLWKKRGGVAVSLDIRTCADPDDRGEALLILAESGVPA